ncbi:hypothetical protein HZZ13_01465 [Bradyrhizobium sp. CNPSo 4010]|uniref:Uncharacterized protein n=1 Tax=Bradyrhizobium agreste TaxID=2751811 RepID=A0ABS0PGZ9_9BRAD|nr:hypothetical protein [Bradyrhizobium agreste]MBH5396478.1 hypothetical protein [Bradyrhizobium agreste]
MLVCLRLSSNASLKNWCEKLFWIVVAVERGTEQCSVSELLEKAQQLEALAPVFTIFTVTFVSKGRAIVSHPENRRVLARAISTALIVALE